MSNSYNEFTVEIATTDFESTKNAVAGGADRIELCANLGEGGTTQSYGVIKTCREKFDVALYPIIRVRGGDFLYTEEEFECMLSDAVNCKTLDCDGVVTGFLKANGDVDTERTLRIVEAVYPLGVTFHRAFDRCRDPLNALEQIIKAGCERILTSGQEATAIKGSTLIRQLNEQAAGRIIIMPGSGVRADNVKALAESTGCTQFHSSLREMIPSRMKYVAPAFAADTESIRHSGIDAAAVAAFKQALY
ncbi:copper homeostasis protein CutC [Niabella beijingensis]|uniref:copper homeostasis protein CutC n=1 Tax=Niabella beijingensis TaxID=2872700 RepID=UPI001CBBB423|nr:copper homeostasis protein CutC [Niabella beijingensis]MBZ4192130.1 copper homeostasis protein CutC [Niabella beijingensis]